MKANLDNLVYFDEKTFELQIKSRQRDVAERKAAGLDGAVSIDMGRRKRELVQTGLLREANEAALNKKIASVEAVFDGQIRTLFTPTGKVFENLRIDSFQTGEFVISGSFVSCTYEIVYTQLG